MPNADYETKLPRAAIRNVRWSAIAKIERPVLLRFLSPASDNEVDARDGIGSVQI
jgi:hypothetical protein